jgi:hypothetical protein
MENERKATPRQLAYIHQLMKRKGDEDTELDESLNFQEASKMIEDLTGIGARNNKVQSAKINESRLGMVLKECFKPWRTNGYDICGKHREAFKKEVIRTYQLFTEIAQELDQSSQMEA